MINEATEAFIQKHLDADPMTLRLMSLEEDIQLELAINQIIGRKKARKKLPSWCNNHRLLFPPKLNLEQSSSELTAAFKASLFDGGNVIDLTGGFGIDAQAIAPKVKIYCYCERDDNLLEIVRHNMSILGVDNIQFIHGDSIRYIEGINTYWDCIFLDPARRGSDSQSKVFRIEDCTPNLVEILPMLFHKAPRIIVKLSPMLDIGYLWRTIPHIRHIWVIGANNEVKELLIELYKQTNQSTLHSIDLVTNHKLDVAYPVTLSPILPVPFSKFIYEPSKVILKAGTQDALVEKFNVRKLHKQTHLYTSNEIIQDFPGRIFQVNRELVGSSKKMKKELPSKKINIISRNHPLTANQIAAKYNLQFGGDLYFLAFTDVVGKHFVLTDRIK